VERVINAAKSPTEIDSHQDIALAISENRLWPPAVWNMRPTSA